MGNRLVRRIEDLASNGVVLVDRLRQIAESIAPPQVLILCAEDPKELNLHLLVTVGES